MNSPVDQSLRPQPASAVIGEGISITGSIVAMGEVSLVIEGQLNGRIDAPRGSVLVAPTGRVHGTIIAQDLDVAGTIQPSEEPGDSVEAQILVTGKLLLQESAQVFAKTISYGSMRMELGAQVRGSIVPSERTASTPKATSTPPALSVVTSGGAELNAAPTADSLGAADPMASLEDFGRTGTLGA